MQVKLFLSAVFYRKLFLNAENSGDATSVNGMTMKLQCELMMRVGFYVVLKKTWQTARILYSSACMVEENMGVCDFLTIEVYISTNFTWLEVL